MAGWVLDASCVHIAEPGAVEGLFAASSCPVRIPDASKADDGQEQGGAQHDGPCTLGRFQSRVLLSVTPQQRSGTSAAPTPAAAADSQHNKRPRQGEQAGAPSALNVDLVLHTGGLVWASAFCPMEPHASLQVPESTGLAQEWPLAAQAARALPLEERAEVLAVSVHPEGVTRNRQGAPVTGPGAVQVSTQAGVWHCA